MTRREAGAVLGVLGILVAVTVPELGSDAWPFRKIPTHPSGVLGPLVRAADGEWDLGIIRAAAILALGENPTAGRWTSATSAHCV